MRQDRSTPITENCRRAYRLRPRTVTEVLRITIDAFSIIADLA